MGARGRGRGSSHTFSREINERMGITTGNAPGQSNEPQVEAVNEPPPLYPPLENRPVPLDTGVEGEYLLALKRDFVEYFHDSPSYLQHTIVKSDIQRFSDRYQTAALASRSISQLVHDWSLLPKELRENGKPLKRKRPPKASNGKAKVQKKAEDITNRLEELEKREEEGSDVDGAETEGAKVDVKEENKNAESEADEEVEDEDIDEEMDDENDDYVNNYFDNGEDYLEDEDDNLDEGGVY